MNKNNQFSKEIKREIQEISERYPKLRDDELFLLWFMKAFITEDESKAIASLTGGSNDKGIDAIFIDESAKLAYLIQSKYKIKRMGSNESRNDVMSLAGLSDTMLDEDLFDDFVNNLNPKATELIHKAYERIEKRKYGLKLFYVTLGKCSGKLTTEAKKHAKRGNTIMDVLDLKRIELLFKDYIDGVAPPVPSINLTICDDNILKRFDRVNDIESWVFSSDGPTIADLFDRSGPRLFARNVRGFLGNTNINKNMEETIRKKPEYFWYYNNGITIICDKAEQKTSKSENVLYIENPQIINGQQTTRILNLYAKKKSNTKVLIKVISVPRNQGNNANLFETLVSNIVAATNWQNAIKASDLMSNDRRQITLERKLSKLNYFYMRKKQTKSEARKLAGAHQTIINKFDLAKSAAACELDPAILREGKEKLFEQKYYKSIFKTDNPEYYLTRYWLFRTVGYTARGFTERGYAKWLVLNFIWDYISNITRKPTDARSFRNMCENKYNSITHLKKSIEAVFDAAIKYYKLNRGTGPSALDASSFFKRRGLHKEFRKFWRGSKNKHRSKFKSSFANFEKKHKQQRQYS